MLNELKIKYYCDRNGFTYRYFYQTAVITTELDTWKLELIDVYDNVNKNYKEIIKVKHQNTLGNKKRKAHFHTQRFAYDLDFIFNNIILPHEDTRRVYQKAFRIKDLLTQNI